MAAEARRIAEKIEWCYTPEHGAWLTMAGLEFSAMQRQCLNRRFADIATLEEECPAWVAAPNHAHLTIKWQFSNAAARLSLHRRYPQLCDKS